MKGTSFRRIIGQISLEGCQDYGKHTICLYHAQVARHGQGAGSFKRYQPVLSPGAKIGVLGLNGAGKSTLLKIMAGIETDFSGEAWPADSIKLAIWRKSQSLTPRWMWQAMFWPGWARQKSW